MKKRRTLATGAHRPEGVATNPMEVDDMTEPNRGLPDGGRLLPWTGPEGKPCYLLASDGAGYVSRMADRVEAAQLESAAELIEEAGHVLRARTWTPGEIHLLAADLTTSLANVRRVAVSRGARLPAPAYDDPDDGAETDADDGHRAGKADHLL
ncbi:hypothetical protein GCM10010211_72240 [Streptomyces albospinus]|uniref:Uncharacterized protein n=1 Tax=Streptomyces albospinus TaxID=285515 RepID=A0ABQ2VL31_9ACTN|nr:hypothetical protein [Streptomyces albospinus]GGU94673.1 hypothetical protein GCM10010211_72240 [Streptomyces albospinus]